MVSKVKVRMKDDEKTLKSDYLAYEKFTVDEDDPVVRAYVQKTRENFKGEPSEITFDIRMEILT